MKFSQLDDRQADAFLKYCLELIKVVHNRDMQMSGFAGKYYTLANASGIGVILAFFLNAKIDIHYLQFLLQFF